MFGLNSLGNNAAFGQLSPKLTIEDETVAGAIGNAHKNGATVQVTSEAVAGSKVSELRPTVSNPLPIEIAI